MENAEASLPASTTPMPLPASIGGLTDPETASEFAHILVNALYTLGVAYDLSRLEAVTATDNYAAAISAVDRGFETSNTLTPSLNENMVGVAMCVHNLRDGVPMVHLVIYIENVLPLMAFQYGDPEYSRAIQLLAHECAHIEDMKVRDEAVPGVILQQRIENELDGMFMPVAESMWQEYYACRRSAGLFPEVTDDFATTLFSCLETNQGTVDEAIKRYRYHADVDVLVLETLEPATRALKVSAYLLGHLDGLNKSLEAVPAVRDRLAGTAIGDLVDDMVSELRRLWSLNGGWTGQEDWHPLIDIAVDAYALAGLSARITSEARVYISV